MRIERRSELAPDEFVERYLIDNRPVVVTGATAHWDLFWTPQQWAERFGDRLVQVYNDLFDFRRLTPLAEFVRTQLGRSGPPGDPAALPYVRWYAKLKDVDFAWADDVFDAIAPCWSRPAFLPAGGYLVPFAAPGREVDPNRTPFPGRVLFVSPRGARTRLHRDPWASDAVLCQLHGTKRATLFAPHDEVRDAPAYEDVLETGETLFIPRGWFHHVSSQTDSVSLSWNFVHAATWSAFFDHLTAPPPADELEVLAYFRKLAAVDAERAR